MARLEGSKGHPHPLYPRFVFFQLIFIGSALSFSVKAVQAVLVCEQQLTPHSPIPLRPSSLADNDTHAPLFCPSRTFSLQRLVIITTGSQEPDPMPRFQAR